MADKSGRVIKKPSQYYPKPRVHIIQEARPIHIAFLAALLAFILLPLINISASVPYIGVGLRTLVGSLCLCAELVGLVTIAVAAYVELKRYLGLRAGGYHGKYGHYVGKTRFLITVHGEPYLEGIYDENGGIESARIGNALSNADVLRIARERDSAREAMNSIGKKVVVY